MGAYQRLFEHGFRRMDAERAHHLGFRAIRAGAPVLSRLPGSSVSGTPVTAMGLTFPHPFGLAAGFDKNAVGIDALGALGFGHVEVGTVTGQAQSGNPQPRLFRLVADRAVVNRMGFNNDGAEVVAARLAARGRRPDGPVLGINIGKTKLVPEDDEAAVLADYARSTRLLAPHADYLVVNVSSPNTPGLRSLQAVERLGPLLAHVQGLADGVPLLVKIAPDLADADVVDVADLALELGLDGIIATNTTIARPPELPLRSHPTQVADAGAGGLSGRPLAERATAVLRLLRERVGPDLTLVGVGGVSTPDDARERLAAGADLVQGYSAFVYEGPLWPRRIVKGISGQ
jgi:dihydroorotate dehydrogenase